MHTLSTIVHIYVYLLSTTSYIRYLTCKYSAYLMMVYFNVDI